MFISEIPIFRARSISSACRLRERLTCVRFVLSGAEVTVLTGSWTAGALRRLPQIPLIMKSGSALSAGWLCASDGR